MTTRRYWVFRAAWWISNLLLAAAVVSTIYTGVWEYSVRKYLDGFSNAIVSDSIPPEQKVETILNWMRSGPSRSNASDPSQFSTRDPETTLNYRQLLAVCGTATNAFLNLSRSAGLQARRLLLLSPNRQTKHVVAEVLIDERWIIVDPAFRVILKDREGHFLTRKELQNPAIFQQATSGIPNYLPEYNYDHFAHVRIARLPLEGLHIRSVLDSLLPGWDEKLDWSLLLERESFFFFFFSFCGVIIFLFLRFLLAWYADNRIRIPRFRLRAHLHRAGTAFLSTPEIK